MKKNRTVWLAILAVVSSAVSFWAGSVWGAVGTENYSSKFSNQGSVTNTRHNMTQQQASGGPSGASMDQFRNNYGEVCVYCHTPHGANSNVALPLWNRTIKATTYTTYAAVGSSSLTQTVTQPGPNSLACLSCHDGQVAVDSIINMPGSGGYKATQATTAVQDTDFLNAWNNAPGKTDASIHIGLNPTPSQGCLACHSNGVGFVGAGAVDFTVFVIGTDLSNDHPVGVRFPTVGPGVDFNPPNGIGTSVRWFDFDGDNRQDINEVRLYDSGAGFAVECASCHDPHGVPSGGAGSTFIPSFLRVNNAFSALCLTCHVK
jgi:hypothetical protein